MILYGVKVTLKMIGCSFFQMFFNIEFMFFEGNVLLKVKEDTHFCISSSII